MKPYDPKKISLKWQKIWDKEKTFQVSQKSFKSSRDKNFYVLDMFPYPSGDGLHVGHVEGYTASDIVSRYYRAKGFNVLHPMGWDAFGLPAENYAIKKKIIPQIVVKKNIANFKRQIKSIGLSYDWSKEINTTDPEYYRWTQWIFLQMFKKGLAYEKETPVNWCPSCKTVLADEESENGKCERCGTQVERKNIKQWMLRITSYADRLIEDLEELNWPNKVKLMQKNWIGKSNGAIINFKIKSHLSRIESEVLVYTTRPDTIFGATYLVVAPENKIISNLESQISNIKEVNDYIEKIKNKSEQERISEVKDKSGVLLKGVVAINPASKKEIPIFIADYVLSSYATGSIMAVPAHDKRDFDFAKKFDLSIVPVISPDGKDDSMVLPYEGEGVLVNSGQFNGSKNQEAISKIIVQIGAKVSTKYKMRDWIFSRQRYWGEPFPLIFCENCKNKIENSSEDKLKKEFTLGEIQNPGWVCVFEKDLPVVLPKVKNYEPTGSTESPLANISKWVNVKCPHCGGKAKRETNTMPQWAGSCWYYLRYIDPKNKNRFIDSAKEKSFMPVDFYIGGVEHATLHLLYARFWHKFLYDIGAVKTKEPFKKLVNQGLILGPDGEKMSKSNGNVINPDEVINQHGADALRMYEMFMGPLEDVKPWSTDGIVGVVRFLQKTWHYFNKSKFLKSGKADVYLEKKLGQTIKKISEDIESLSLNTAISSLMVLLKEFERTEKVLEDQAKDFIKLLAPFAPFICEEIWQVVFKNKKSISSATWPKFSQKAIKEDIIYIAVQINGKTRGIIQIKKGSEKDLVSEVIKKDGKLSRYFLDVAIKKVIFIPDRVINFII